MFSTTNTNHLRSWELVSTSLSKYQTPSLKTRNDMEDNPMKSKDNPESEDNSDIQQDQFQEGKKTSKDNKEDDLATKNITQPPPPPMESVVEGVPPKAGNHGGPHGGTHGAASMSTRLCGYSQQTSKISNERTNKMSHLTLA